MRSAVIIIIVVSVVSVSVVVFLAMANATKSWSGLMVTAKRCMDIVLWFHICKLHIFK